jgi:hypothetical protein
MELLKKEEWKCGKQKWNCERKKKESVENRKCESKWNGILGKKVCLRGNGNLGNMMKG